MKYEQKAKIVIAATVIVFILALMACGAPIDPNTLPFGVDPNAYTAPIVYWDIAAPNVPIQLQTTLRNKGGWDCDLSITMADGSVTSVLIESVTPKPVTSTVGFEKRFDWQWTPPAEGVFYLELRGSAVGRPTWKQARGTVIVYCYGEDSPEIEMPDPPIIASTDTWSQIYQKWAKVRPFVTTTLAKRNLRFEILPVKLGVWR